MEEVKGIIEKLAQSMADMTLCAIETERQRAAEKKNADDWYKLYKDRDDKLKEAHSKLADEIREHAKTKAALDEALEAASKLSDEVEALMGAQKTAQKA